MASGFIFVILPRNKKPALTLHGFVDGWVRVKGLQRLTPAPIWADTYKPELVDKDLLPVNRDYTADLMFSLTF